MKTASLVLWDRNENLSNIYLSQVGGDKLFLKPFYIEVFKRCADSLKDSRVGSFVELWVKTCNEACEKVFTALSAKVVHDEAGEWKPRVERVESKFRGNLGEMLVELMAENGLLDFIKPGTYEPVDPTNEEFVDATAKRNGLPVGIQVKNYNTYHKVDDVVFIKAAAMSDLWIRRDGIVKEENLKEFMSSPCQYIISTSDPCKAMLEENFRKSVVFLGPKWLESKKIQGSAKTGESAKWKMFEEAAEELDKVTASQERREAMKSQKRDAPAVRPSREVCKACPSHGMCLAEAGEKNYRCPAGKASSQLPDQRSFDMIASARS